MSSFPHQSDCNRTGGSFKLSSGQTVTIEEGYEVYVDLNTGRQSKHCKACGAVEVKTLSGVDEIGS